MALIRCGGGSSVGLKHEIKTVSSPQSTQTITLPSGAQVAGIYAKSTIGSGVGDAGAIGVMTESGLKQQRFGATSPNVTSYNISVSDNVVTVTWSGPASTADTFTCDIVYA